MYNPEKTYAEKSVELLFLIMVCGSFGTFTLLPSDKEQRLEETRSLTGDFDAMSSALQTHLEDFLASLSKFAGEGAPKLPQNARGLEIDLERLQTELHKLSDFI